MFHKVQWPRIQKNQKLKVSDHALSKNKKTTSKFSIRWLKEHTLIKNPHSPVNAIN